MMEIFGRQAFVRNSRLLSQRTHSHDSRPVHKPRFYLIAVLAPWRNYYFTRYIRK